MSVCSWPGRCYRETLLWMAVVITLRYRSIVSVLSSVRQCVVLPPSERSGTGCSRPKSFVLLLSHTLYWKHHRACVRASLSPATWPLLPLAFTSTLALPTWPQWACELFCRLGFNATRECNVVDLNDARVLDATVGKERYGAGHISMNASRACDRAGGEVKHPA